jgi:hypothetical protein
MQVAVGRLLLDWTSHRFGRMTWNDGGVGGMGPKVHLWNVVEIWTFHRAHREDASSNVSTGKIPLVLEVKNYIQTKLLIVALAIVNSTSQTTDGRYHFQTCSYASFDVPPFTSCTNPRARILHCVLQSWQYPVSIPS